MKYQTLVERLVAVALIVAGALLKNFVLTGIGITYFIIKIAD